MPKKLLIFTFVLFFNARAAADDFSVTATGIIRENTSGNTVNTSNAASAITNEVLRLLSGIASFNSASLSSSLYSQILAALNRETLAGNNSSAGLGSTAAQTALNFSLGAFNQGLLTSRSGDALGLGSVTNLFTAPGGGSWGGYGNSSSGYSAGDGAFRSYVEADRPCSDSSCSFSSRPDTIVQESSSQRERALEILVGEGKNPLIEEFDGWSDYYQGYSRSPLLFEPKAKEKISDSGGVDSQLSHLKKYYPTLADYKGHAQEQDIKNKLSLSSVNLGVDDEIRKTSMAVYKPLRWIETDWADDEVGRDAHLNLFKTLRGVATLTLSYLDKTVAAGLATVQEQADSNSTNQLLKQISWTTKELVNPNRAQLFKDTDEKLEYCLAAAGKAESKKVILDCQQSCGAAPTSGKGLYHFCVCCAESTTKINRTAYNSQQAPEGFEKENFSLVERAFAGTNLPTQDKSGGWNKFERVQDVIKHFKSMYGDLIVGPPDSASAAVASGEPGFELAYHFDLPSLSVPQQIDVIRNGCRSYYDTGGTMVCPFTGASITLGVCPALYKLIRYENNRITQTARAGSVPSSVSIGSDSIDDSTLKAIWAEASLAFGLDARALQNILKLGGLPNGQELGDNWLPQGALRRWTDSFCDASAVIVYRRLHLRMEAIALQHLVLSQSASARDKERIVALMDRTGSEIALAEADAQADWAAEQHVTGISIETDREKEAEIANTVAAQLAHMRNSAMGGSYTAWGSYQRVK